MATQIVISYSDGSQERLKYQLSVIARKMRHLKAIKRFRDMKYTPILPFLVKIAITEAEQLAASGGEREITKITITEKV